MPSAGRSWREGATPRAHTGQGIRSVIDVRRGWRRFPAADQATPAQSRRVRENPWRRARRTSGSTRPASAQPGRHHGDAPFPRHASLSASWRPTLRGGVEQQDNPAPTPDPAGGRPDLASIRWPDPARQHCPTAHPTVTRGPCRLWTVDPETRRRIRASSSTSNRVAVTPHPSSARLEPMCAAVAGLVTGSTEPSPTRARPGVKYQQHRLLGTRRTRQIARAAVNTSNPPDRPPSWPRASDRRARTPPAPRPEPNASPESCVSHAASERHFHPSCRAWTRRAPAASPRPHWQPGPPVNTAFYRAFRAGGAGSGNRQPFVR